MSTSTLAFGPSSLLQAIFLLCVSEWFLSLTRSALTHMSFSENWHWMPAWRHEGWQGRSVKRASKCTLWVPVIGLLSSLVCFQLALNFHGLFLKCDFRDNKNKNINKSLALKFVIAVTQSIVYICCTLTNHSFQMNSFQRVSGKILCHFDDPGNGKILSLTAE